MKYLRNIITYLMMPLLFVWYIGGINLFPHTHIVGGVAVVHSHPFTDTEHGNEDNLQTIDMLCHFHSDTHPDGVFIPEVYIIPISGEAFGEAKSVSLQSFYWTFSLRGPPQA